jgi:hypothetical protein
MTRWITLESETPPDEQLILVCDEISKFMSIARLSVEDMELDIAGLGKMDIPRDLAITHWMPLPEFPQQIGLNERG